MFELDVEDDDFDFEDKGDDGDGGTAEELESCRRADMETYSHRIRGEWTKKKKAPTGPTTSTTPTPNPDPEVPKYAGSKILTMRTENTCGIQWSVFQMEPYVAS